MNVPYTEMASDHAMTAFLAALTPSMVLKDHHPKSKVERKRLRFFVRKAAIEKHQFFTAAQLRVAAEWAERQAAS